MYLQFTQRDRSCVISLPGSYRLRLSLSDRFLVFHCTAQV